MKKKTKMIHCLFWIPAAFWENVKLNDKSVEWLSLRRTITPTEATIYHLWCLLFILENAIINVYFTDHYCYYGFYYGYYY